MLNQYAVDIPTSPVNLSLCHLIQFLVDCEAVHRECRAAEKCHQVFGTRVVHWDTFLQIQFASSTEPFPQELDPQSSTSSRFETCSVEDSSKNHGADLDKFPTPATFACWNKTEVCTCSQFPTEAMQWIKEVELVHSVDELRSSSSIRGISRPNF